MVAEQSAGRLLRIGLGIAAVLLVANTLASWYLSSLSTRNEAYRTVTDKWNLLLDLPQPVDVLILGDSTCNQGVMPSIIHEQLGLTALNLCTFGDLLVANDAWMLETYIERYGPPKMVIMVHALDEWERTFTRNPLWAKIPQGQAFWRGLPPDIGISKLDRQWMLFQRYVPLYWETNSLSSPIIDPWSASKPAELPGPDGFTARAGDSAAELAQQAATLLQREAANPSRVGFSMSSANSSALERVLDLSETSGFSLVLFNSPEYEPLLKQAWIAPYLDQMAAVFGRYEAVYPNFHYLLREPMTFPGSQMQSGDHVTAEGAVAYTERIVSEVKALHVPTERAAT
jgi:hypothetical protein